MASIKKRLDGKWRARYRDDANKEHAQHFDTKAAAQNWLDQITTSVVSGTYVDPKAGRQLFRDYAETWRAAQVHRSTTAVQIEARLRLHVYPTFGDRPISTIRRTEIQAWVKGLTEVLAPTTVEVVFRWFATIMRAAVEDAVIRTSPCRGVKLPRKERVQVVPLEPEQIWRLADTISPRYRAAVVLAAGTGLRHGEVFGLTLDRVDFLRRTVRVDQQLLALAGTETHLAPPKTGASVRTVPLPQIVVDALAAHLAAYPANEDGFVFTSANGGPVNRSRFYEAWNPAVEKAELPAGTVFHDLRHAYASLLIRHGESVKVVQERLGHANPMETLGTYSHLFPDSDDRTREAIDAALSPRLVREKSAETGK